MTLFQRSLYPSHMRLTGLVLDIYDDPQASMLRGAFASEPLPVKLASMPFLEPDQLAQLPDRLFALVADNDEETVRKYAMHDAGHVLSSLVYFMECGGCLPESAQQKVAANLVNACAWYDLDPPEPVVKLALGLGSAVTAGLGALDVANAASNGAKRSARIMDTIRSAQAAGAKVASGREITMTEAQVDAITHGSPQGLVGAGPADGISVDAASHMSLHNQTWDKIERQSKKTDQIDNVAMGKKADLTGTEMMPASGSLPNKVTRTNTSKLVSTASKTAAWQRVENFSKHELRPAAQAEKFAHYALPHKGQYPLDTEDQMKMAQAYFEMYRGRLSPLDRHIFAQATLKRAEDLGVKLAGSILNYAGESYGPRIVPELQSRISSFEGTGHEVGYQALLEKRAEMPPAVMAHLLSEADIASGAELSYGRPAVGFLDPWEATYGSAKVAAATEEDDTFSWVQGNDYVTGTQLTALAQSPKGVSPYFDDAFAKSFAADPVGIFESLPDPQKVVLARLASNNTGTTFRI